MSQHNKKPIGQYNTTVREPLPIDKKNSFVIEALGDTLAHDRDRNAFYQWVLSILPDLERYATRGQIVSISKYWQKTLGEDDMNPQEEKLRGQLRQLVVDKQQAILYDDIDIPDKQGLIDALNKLGSVQIRYHTAPGAGISHPSTDLSGYRIKHQPRSTNPVIYNLTLGEVLDVRWAEDIDLRPLIYVTCKKKTILLRYLGDTPDRYGFSGETKRAVYDNVTADSKLEEVSIPNLYGGDYYGCRIHYNHDSGLSQMFTLFEKRGMIQKNVPYEYKDPASTYRKDLISQIYKKK